MADLIEWLRTQLDEDERVAREASGDKWATGTSMAYKYSQPGDVYAIAPDGSAARIAVGTRCGPDISAEQSSDHIARHDPDRVLTEVESKRRMLDWIADTVDRATNCDFFGVDDDEAYRLLALPYAGRDGYREEWRP